MGWEELKTESVTQIRACVCGRAGPALKQARQDIPDAVIARLWFNSDQRVVRLSDGDRETDRQTDRQTDRPKQIMSLQVCVCVCLCVRACVRECVRVRAQVRKGQSHRILNFPYDIVIKRLPSICRLNVTYSPSPSTLVTFTWVPPYLLLWNYI